MSEVMAKVEYIVVKDDEVKDYSRNRLTRLLEQGGEILQSWVTDNAVHHLVQYEPVKSQSRRRPITLSLDESIYKGP